MKIVKYHRRLSVFVLVASALSRRKRSQLRDMALLKVAVGQQSQLLSPHWANPFDDRVHASAHAHPSSEKSHLLLALC
jgi:hypothetical protein